MAPRRSTTADKRIDINAIIDYIHAVPNVRHPASITIRNLEPAIKERLRVRAAQHGHSMEAEARRILQSALTPAGAPPTRHLYDRVRARFAAVGGFDFELPAREPAREPPKFD